MKQYTGDVIPMSIWLASMEEIDEISTLLVCSDGSDIDFDYNANACVIDVITRDGKYRGDLVVFNKNKHTPPVMAHEAFHVAHNWISRLDIDIYRDGTNETWAYMIEWTVRCMVDYFILSPDAKSKNG